MVKTVKDFPFSIAQKMLVVDLPGYGFAIQGVDIADGEITRTKIKAGEITSSKIADRNIGSQQMALLSVTGNHIADNTINTSKIQSFSCRK